MFEAAHLANEGDVVAWDEADLELPAEAIEAIAEQTMTPEAFVAFMKGNNLTEEAIASILDYSRRQIGYFKTTGPIPRVVALACKGYENELLEHFADRIAVNYETADQPPLPKPKVKVA